MSLVMDIYLSACDWFRIIGVETDLSFDVCSDVPWVANTTRYKVALSVMFLSRSLTQVFSSISVTLYSPMDIGASLISGPSVGL